MSTRTRTFVYVQTQDEGSLFYKQENIDVKLVLPF